MKKAQILSAIALAFALGVVIPVAGLTNNASAYNEAAGTATLADVNNAIDYVENSNGYKAFQALVAAHEAYDRGVADGTIDDLAVATGSATATVADDIKTAITTAQGADGHFGYNTTSINNQLTKEKIYTDQISTMIAAANTSDLYKKYAAIQNIIDDTNATDAQLQQAVREFRVAAGPQGLGLLSQDQYDTLHPEQAKLSSYRASNPVAAFSGYTQAIALQNKVEDAQEALDAYNKGYKLFIPLLNNSSIVSKAAKDYIANTINVTLEELDKLATNDSTTTANSVAHYDDWGDVADELNTVKNDRRIDESGDNYSIIGDLAQAWKEATGNEEALKTVMARMAAYKAPANSDNNGNNTDTTIKPGNTGLVGSAEGTATTVSIVAGLATALTALGAGVVVYRNARREK